MQLIIQIFFINFNFQVLYIFNFTISFHFISIKIYSLSCFERQQFHLLIEKICKQFNLKFKININVLTYDCDVLIQKAYSINRANLFSAIAPFPNLEFCCYFLEIKYDKDLKIFIILF